MSTTFDPIGASAKMLELAQHHSGHRLPRVAHYHAFALLQSGVKQEIISRMFGISLSSVSHLANCLARGRIIRYPHVFNEWKTLGRDEFIRAYLTEDHYLQAERLRLDMGRALDDKTSRAPNPHADSCAYKIRGAFQVGEDWFRIDWAEADPEIAEAQRGQIGWRYAQIVPDSQTDKAGPYMSISPYDESTLRADEVWMPWRTSGEAFDYVFEAYGLKSPRRPGRPRK
jgi:hypothetical protein